MLIKRSFRSTTQSQLVWSFESQGVSKILTACRMLQISIAQRQMKAKIHSFPTMYILGGGRCGRNGSNQGFRPRIRPKNIYFSGTKSWSSDFGGVWDPQILKCCHFRHYPSKWVSVKMSYGHVRYLWNCPNAGLLHYFSEQTRVHGQWENFSRKKGFFAHFGQLLQCKYFSRISRICHRKALD